MSGDWGRPPLKVILMIVPWARLVFACLATGDGRPLLFTNDCAGKWARLSVFAMTPTFGITGDIFFVQMRFFRSDGIDDWREIAVNGDNMEQGSWTQVFTVGTIVPDTTTNILVTLIKRPAYGTVFFDDCSLEISSVLNPSFETGVGYSAWYWLGCWETPTWVVGRTNKFARSGDYSVCIRGTGVAWANVNQIFLDPELEGKAVNASTWLLTPSYDPISNVRGGGITFDWLGALYEDVEIIGPSSQKDTWLYGTSTKIAPAGATGVVIRITRYCDDAIDGGSMFIDDVSVNIYNVDESKLQNTSFESGVSYVADFWMNCSLGNTYGVVRTNDIAHSGEFSMKIYGSGASWISCCQDIFNDDISGQSIEISAWMYTPENDPLIASTLAKIEWYGVTGEIANEMLTSTNEHDAWINCVTTIEAPEGAYGATICFMRSVEDGGGTVYIDDVDASIIPEPSLLIISSLIFLIFYQFKTK